MWNVEWNGIEHGIEWNGMWNGVEHGINKKSNDIHFVVVKIYPSTNITMPAAAECLQLQVVCIFETYSRCIRGNIRVGVATCLVSESQWFECPNVPRLFPLLERA